MPHFCRASCPSHPALYPTAIPSRLGNASWAASRVSTTRCPRDPLGALSLATSTSVNTPSNGNLFGWPCTSGKSTAIAWSCTCFCASLAARSPHTLELRSFSNAGADLSSIGGKGARDPVAPLLGRSPSPEPCSRPIPVLVLPNRVLSSPMPKPPSLPLVTTSCALVSTVALRRCALVTRLPPTLQLLQQHLRQAAPLAISRPLPCTIVWSLHLVQTAQRHKRLRMRYAPLLGFTHKPLHNLRKCLRHTLLREASALLRP